MRTFMDSYRAGQVSAEQIDDHIDRWHDDPNPFGPKLHEFLGLTWDEYKRWAETGQLPKVEPFPSAFKPCTHGGEHPEVAAHIDRVRPAR